MKLDRIDLKILSVLQADGRITKQRLAERVALSPSACFERLRRLEQAGIVAGYHAELALDRIARNVVVLVEVELAVHSAAAFETFERALDRVEEVQDCWSVGGGTDYYLRVVARDIAHYQAVIDRLLAWDIGIARYQTYVVTKQTKGLPLVPLHLVLPDGSADSD
ncbi:MAG: Lrp/AsnC family transcriptional regulator [Rhodospirillaceae bacterium]|nr:Lrp/AsnC family transcriptional regulator [Rhodospirillaceae bacterium]